MIKNLMYYCDKCNCVLNVNKDHIQQPDPYDSEINDNYDPVDLCEDCYELQCEDI